MPVRVLWMILMSFALVVTVAALRRAIRRYQDEEFLIGDDVIIWRYKKENTYEIRPWNLVSFEVQRLSFKKRFAILTSGEYRIPIFDTLSCFDLLRQKAETLLSERPDYLNAFR